MRPIDADKLKKLAFNIKDCVFEDELNDAVVSLKAIDNAPTVERPKGKWILIGDDVEDESLAWFSCSECDAVDKLDKNNIKAKYCWNCGAQMGGDEK